SWDVWKAWKWVENLYEPPVGIVLMVASYPVYHPLTWMPMLVIAATAISEMKAASNAYSTRSCPHSSRTALAISRLIRVPFRKTKRVPQADVSAGHPSSMEGSCPQNNEHPNCRRIKSQPAGHGVRTCPSSSRSKLSRESSGDDVILLRTGRLLTRFAAS